MKKTFFLAFIVLIFLNCNNSSVKEQRDNALLKKYFTKEEIKDLDKIIDFYDNIVLSKTKTDNINDAYHKYFAKIKENLNSKGIPCMDTMSVDKLFSRLSQSTIKKIWYKSIGKKRIDTNYNKWPPEYIGKSFLSLSKNAYFNFLTDYSENNQYLKDYIDVINKVGDISPTTIKIFLMNSDKFDFYNKTNRLIFAIHYITIGYNFFDC